jgi:hypothetical protein
MSDTPRKKTLEEAIAHDLADIERMRVADYTPDIHDEAFSLTLSKGAEFAKAHLDRKYLETRAERLARGEGFTRTRATEPGKDHEPER